MVSGLKTPGSRPARVVFWLLAILIFVLLPLLSLDAGISGDEPVHYRQAAFVHQYFSTSGQDTSALHTPKTNLKYYGQVFDNLSYAVNHITGSKHPYQTRHLMNALAGAVLILFAGLLAVSLGGYPAGVLAMLFLFLSPRLLGHSFNNLKDVPFALGYLMTVWGLTRSLQYYPHIKWKPLLIITIGFALAFGTRAGGLVLIPMVFFFGFLQWIIYHRKSFGQQDSWKKGLIFSVFLLLSLTVGYGLGILYWPYALENPLSHPWEALHMMTHYEISIRTVFEGNWLWSEKLPWYYGIKWIIISNPLIILLGFLFFFFQVRKQPAAISALLIFSAFFPIFWTIIKNANLYGGWRHLLFVYPPMAILSALAWTQLYRNFKPKWARWAAIILLIAGLSGPAWHIIRNHPVEYAYFNRLTGGVNQVAGKYETDYYYHAIRQALEWVQTHSKLEQQEEPLRIASNFPLNEYNEYFDDLFEPVYTHYYNRGKVDWDYGIFSSTYIDPQQLSANNWPAEEPVHTIYVGHTPVAVVLKRGSKTDLMALQAYRNYHFQEADSLYRAHLSEIPNHETSLLYRGWALRHLKQYSESDAEASTLLSIHPLSDLARHLQVRNAISTGAYEQAEHLLNQLQTNNYKFLPAYSSRGLLYEKTSHPAKAADFLEKGYQLGLRDSTTLDRLIRCLETSGNTAKADKFRTILKK